MILDEETRIIIGTKLKLTNDEMDEYERGHLKLSKNDELIIRSTKLSRIIGKEMSDVVPILDKCDVFNANKLLFNIAYKIGEVYNNKNLTFDDQKELMLKLNEYNTAGKLICECKNKVQRT